MSETETAQWYVVEQIKRYSWLIETLIVRNKEIENKMKRLELDFSILCIALCVAICVFIFFSL